MKAFDVFVLSSVQETFGRVLLEAAIARTSIIATRVHGIPEVLGDTGQLISERNPKELAEAMLLNYQWSMEERQHAIDKTYQRITTHFSLPAFRETFSRLLGVG